MSENSRGSTDEQATSYPGSGCVGGDDRVVIAGSRSFWSDISLVEDPPRYVGQVIRSLGWSIDTVLSGTADGADTAGERWAESVGLPVERHPADWDEHGKAAGPIRNQQMAEQADKVLVLWDGESRGSKSMIDCARDELGRENVHVHRYREESPDDAGGDDDDSDDDGVPSNPAVLDPSAIDGIGGVREYRLDRDLDIHTVTGVAEASLDTLTEVWSIGEIVGGRVKGRAQGMVTAYEDHFYPDDDERAEMTDEARPSGDAQYGDATSRVAVVFGEGIDGLDSLALRDLVGDALEQAHIPVYDELQVGYVAGWSADDPYGEMGGRIVRDWIDEQLALGRLVDDKEFHTPWTKYAMAWNREEVEPYWQTWNYDSAPADESTALSDIPFATPRGWQDIGAWMAPAERTRELVSWAQEVVIVTDGEYTDSLRYQCSLQDVRCTTVYGKPVEAGDGLVVDEYIPLEADDTGPEETDTITGRAGWTYVTDDDGDILFDEAGNPLTRQVDDEEYETSKEWREGSPNELQKGDVLETGVTVRDEHWPDADRGTAGGGVGSNSDRTGEYRDSLL